MGIFDAVTTAIKLPFAPVQHERSKEKMLELWAKDAEAPPMPWFSLRDMNDEDLKAIYHFVRSLGPSGKPEGLSTPWQASRYSIH